MPASPRGRITGAPTPAIGLIPAVLVAVGILITQVLPQPAAAAVALAVLVAATLPGGMPTGRVLPRQMAHARRRGATS